MSIEENKAIAVKLFENLSNLKLDNVLDALAEDGRWWVLGGTYFGQTLNKEQFRKQLKALATAVPGGLNLKISRVIGEDDTVVVEAEGRGQAAGNKIYNNHYVWVLTLRDGKVLEGKEYMDTLHVLDTFGPVMRPKSQT